QLAHVAGDDIIELVEREIDAVIGEAILGKVVGADAIAAVAAADKRAPLLGPLPMDFLLLHFVKPAAEDAHGPLAVLVLAALILAFHLETGRDVADTNGTFRLIDVLAAGAPG